VINLLLLLGLFAVLLVARVPVAFAMGLASLGTLAITAQAPPIILVNRMAASADSFILIAIPLFILTGAYMDTGGIAMRLLTLARVLVGHLRGSLGMITVVSEMFFSGISGSTVADVSAMSSMMLPAMKRADYKPAYSVSIISAASAMGMLIPPCIPMVVLAPIINVSIGTLFLAGFLPAIVLAAFIMALLWVQAVQMGLPAGPRPRAREVVRGLVGALIPLTMPVIIFGGIFGGVFSPTEAAAVAALYGALVGVFVYRELTVRKLMDLAIYTGIATGTVMLLIEAASTFSYLMAVNHLPELMARGITAVSSAPWFFLVVNALIFIFIGSILEGLPALIIFVPILFPMVQSLGIDPIHYGILVIAATGIGLFIPPAGVGLIIACSIGQVTLGEVTRPLLPFLVVLFVGLMVLTVVPWFSVSVPQLLLR